MRVANDNQTDPAAAGGAAGTLPADALLRAMIGACAYVAFADGRLDVSERRRILGLMELMPMFKSYSQAEVTDAFSRQERMFSLEPRQARVAALQSLETLRLHGTEARLLISACQRVLEADGVHHPSEYQALQEIGQALGPA